MTSDDLTLWALTKGGHGARAVTREIPGVGTELRYYWDGEHRQSKVYRNGEKFAGTAGAKRDAPAGERLDGSDLSGVEELSASPPHA